MGLHEGRGGGDKEGENTGQGGQLDVGGGQREESRVMPRFLAWATGWE